MTPQEPIDLAELKTCPATMVALSKWACSSGKGRAIDYFLVSDAMRGATRLAFGLAGTPGAAHW